MTITIVIATYNRAPVLAAALHSLASQAYQPGDEIVVADNGSTDDTAEVVRRAAASFAVPVRYAFEARPGKSIALATALEGCRADVIAVTDDDVFVAQDWVGQIRDTMTATGAALVGGRVLPLFQGRVPDWLDLGGRGGFARIAAPLGLADYGRAREPLGPRTAMGGNMAIRRSVFETLGGFASELGKIRGTLLSGEDRDLTEQVQAAGYLALYEPGMVVRHLVPADRLNVRYFLRWFFWSGVVHARIDATRPPKVARLLGVPRYLFRQLVGSAALALAAVLVAGWTSAVTHATDVAFSLGYMWASWSSRPHPARSAAPARTEAA